MIESYSRGMERVYTRFDAYDFEGDETFQSGLKSLQSSDAVQALEIKLFFYNRFVEPIDSRGYKDGRGFSTEQPSSLNYNVKELEKLNHLAITDSNCSNIYISTDGASANTGASLSFSEVIRLVQLGEAVPGLSKMDIRPSNEPPTPSQMDRVLKPWEKPALPQ